MSTPICRCRVLYLGSAVPHVTKDGLQGIQEPLRELYPDEGVLGARGIDSWLSVWSNGLLLENVDEHGKRITRFFPVETLHYCAAVRHVVVPGAEGERVSRFLPLDSPFARIPTSHNPPLFACILRRTTGIKVLECHAFICKKEMAANALVRCCFHSYADNTFARQLEAGKGPPLPVTSIQKVEEWNAKENGTGDGGDITSIYNGDENHKVWAGSPVTSVRSVMTPSETTRSSRPRQMILPSKPPPPPVTDDDKPKEKPRRLANGRDSSRQMPVKHWAIPPPNASVAPRGTLPLMLMARSAEEPTYMPSARPLSPIASYQPAAFPYDQYLLHQHHHQHHHHPQRPIKTKRKQKSPGGDADSKFSTGIYRKKGHLNERAFSYSIRQEHRSRSHSSLATLAFSNGDRDISQMVTEISLSEDETDDEQQPSPQPPPN